MWNTKEIIGILQGKDLGELSHFFCINILQDKKISIINLNQFKYICQNLKEFGLKDIKAIATSMV